MERQRSFSFKSSRFLVFTFTISTSFIFLTTFSFWLIKSNPLVHEETHIQFNKPSPNLGYSSTSVQNLSSFGENVSASGTKDSVLEDVHLVTTDSASGFPKFSVSGGIPSQETEAELAVDSDSVIGNLTSGEAAAPEASFEITEVQINEGSEQEQIEASSFEKIELPREHDEEKKSRVISLEKNEALLDGRIEKKIGECDVTKGIWVRDESYPLYSNTSCPFIDEGFNCESNGRQDKGYTKWKWQPQGCDMRRFNATKMLELIRGKRLVFAGDSINRNQWESMLCMLMGAIPDPKRVYETHGRRITKEKGDYSFRFVDYKCTVEYHVSHFLVHEGKARIGSKRKPTLRIDTIDRSSSKWRGADILIFNSAHWWSHHKTKAGINYYQEGSQVHPRLDAMVAYRRALMTWASWVDKHINPAKTQVFYRNSSPSHFRGGQWNSGGHCAEASRPLNDISGMIYTEKNKIVEEVIMQMKTPVTLLNVTGLSAYRIDGHPAIYGKKPGKGYSSGIQDCSHWCLPGVPDTWNELLYFHLQSKQISSFH